VRDALDAIRDLIQEDVGGRGLAADPAENLLSVAAGDFRAACRSIVGHPRLPAVVIVTGFFIPQASPPAGETDGPLGALFLARALAPLGIKVALATDDFCMQALAEGLKACGLGREVALVELPAAASDDPLACWQEFRRRAGAAGFSHSPSHLVAVERVGPSHTLASLQAQPGSTPGDLEQFQAEVLAGEHDRCHTMRGLDVTDRVRPAHLLFEAARRAELPVVTIGIGDGGNEIGMGRVPWRVVRRNIARGGLVACRVPADHLIVCGVSNWGAYGLAAGVLHLLGADDDPSLFSIDRERELLQLMVDKGPLVDGLTGRPEATVDGLPFERYAAILARLRDVLATAP
jgi:hypothetical protein